MSQLKTRQHEYILKLRGQFEYILLIIIHVSSR